MQQTRDAKAAEIERNLRAFLDILPNILADHAGEYALMHDGKIVGFHATALDAQIAGNQRYDPERFSIQQVQDAPAELGFYSYALHPR